MNKKGQGDYPIMVFAFFVLALLIFGVVMFKVNNIIGTKFADVMGNQTPVAGQNVRAVTTTFANFWDFVIIFVLVINILLLFVSSFLVDTHPVFLVLYIVMGIILFIIAPSVLQVVDSMYTDTNIICSDPTLPCTGDNYLLQKLSMLEFVRQYYAIILLSIFFLSGIIMYSKYRLAGPGGMM